jgi:2-succinyl-5-enolpyruvyl-6-hydroxy-3-cyclohexene-1-carboxylate synthase
MEKFYTNEKNAQVIISLLKQNGIKRIIASPGTTNMALTASMQNDPYFEMYSSVDERSAAYMACGLSAETGEPVVLSCTGATASRNYMPGLTEAFYRKLPVLAITSMQRFSSVGNHIAQVIDRSVMPKDVVKMSVELPVVETDDNLWDCELKVNKAILELKRHGGGPVHINLPTIYDKSFSTKVLPNYRMISRTTQNDTFPEISKNRIAVFVGAHKNFTDEETKILDSFCASNNAVVFCDHTSGYFGKFKVQFSLAGFQEGFSHQTKKPDLLIHIGEITGDYYTIKMRFSEVWRVNEDGELRDTFKCLTKVFEMPESVFFKHFTSDYNSTAKNTYLEECNLLDTEIRKVITEVPFSNIWIASQIAHKIPANSVIHFAILNSLRAWNFFKLPNTVNSNCNVGGFGIDGCVSSLIGASFVNKDKLYFGVIGDLALFYDINVLGNKHVGNNVRILMINNGKGTEFRNYNHPAAHFQNEADRFTAAAGHFGNKSPELIKSFATNLGYEYMTANTKENFSKTYSRFLTAEITDRPMLFEVFTDSEEESNALEQMVVMGNDMKNKAKGVAAQILGKKGINALKSVLKK